MVYLNRTTPGAIRSDGIIAQITQATYRGRPEAGDLNHDWRIAGAGEVRLVRWLRVKAPGRERLETR